MPCGGIGLGQRVYLDATKVAANASPASRQPRFAVEAQLFAAVGDANVADDGSGGLDGEGGGDEPAELPVAQTDEARAELAESPTPRHDWIGHAGRPNHNVKSGAYRRTAEFPVTTTAPDATPIPFGTGLTRSGHQDHYVINGGKARIALVAPAEVQENQPMRDLLWRGRFRWKLRPRQVTANTMYGTAAKSVAIEDERTHAYIPLPDLAAHKADIFGASAFTYDAEQSVFHCPGGETLRFRRHRVPERLRVYQASADAR